MAKPSLYERKALEKIWNVLQEIEEQRRLSRDGAELRMFFIPPGFAGSLGALEPIMRDRRAVMDKLESLKAISIIEVVNGIDGGWVFKIGQDYEKVFPEHEDQYGHAAGLYEEAKEAEQENYAG